MCMWKILHKSMPNPNIKFRPRSRLGIQAFVPSLAPAAGLANQSRYDASFAVVGPTLWNALPGELTLIEPFIKFKNALTTFLRRLDDMPPISGYARAHDNSLPEVLRRAEDRFNWR